MLNHTPHSLFTSERESDALPERRRILVMRYRFIGDTLLTVPFLRNLRAAYPQAKIDLLAAPNSGELLRDCPYIDELLFYDTTRQHRYENPENGVSRKSFWHYATLLRKKRYDTAFVLKRSLSSAVLAWVAGIPNRIGFDTEGRGVLLTQKVPYRADALELDCYLDVLKAAGIPVRDRYLEAWWQSSEEKNAKLALGNASSQHVVLHLTSSNTAKQWPLEQAAQLASWLLQSESRMIHCLGAMSDRSVYEALLARLSPDVHERVKIHCGALSLLDSMAFLRQMALVVGVDSGTLHMAAAVGVPVVALFGPMDERKWAPEGSRVVVQPMECRPCGLKRPCVHAFACMKDLQTETVIETIKTYAGFA